MFNALNSRVTRMNGAMLCALFLIATIIPSVLLARLFHLQLNGSVPENEELVAILTAICISVPLILHSVVTIRRLEGSKVALRERSDLLNAKNEELAVAESRLREANNTLETRVKERTADAESAQRLAEEASKSKSMFLANMSHELRTPLNAIIGFAEVLSKRDQIFPDANEDRIDEYSAAIHRSGQFLLQLVNDLLDLSRIDCGQFDIVPERIGVEALVGDVLTSLGHDQRIEVEMLCQSRYFHADRRAAHQILVNLVSNALKFSDPDGAVRLRIEDNPTGTTFTVADTGMGMTRAEAIEAIKPFSRLSDAHIASGESIGLGLAIVSSLCTLHGCPLELTSEKGVGTRAIARFPSPIGRAEGQLIVAPSPLRLPAPAPVIIEAPVPLERIARHA